MTMKLGEPQMIAYVIIRAKTDYFTPSRRLKIHSSQFRN